MKTTLKEIKAFNAIDITYISSEDMKKLLKKECSFNYVAYSTGLYGTTGVVIQGFKTKTLYKITSRTSTLYMI